MRRAGRQIGVCRARTRARCRSGPGPILSGGVPGLRRRGKRAPSRGGQIMSSQLSSVTHRPPPLGSPSRGSWRRGPIGRNRAERRSVAGSGLESQDLTRRMGQRRHMPVCRAGPVRLPGAPRTVALQTAGRSRPPSRESEIGVVKCRQEALARHRDVSQTQNRPAASYPSRLNTER